MPHQKWTLAESVTLAFAKLGVDDAHTLESLTNAVQEYWPGLLDRSVEARLVQLVRMGRVERRVSRLTRKVRYKLNIVG